MRIRSLAVLTIVLGVLAGAPACADELASLAIDKLLWDGNERLLSLRLTVQGGRIVSLRALPAQWAITIDNSSSAKGTATLEAQSAMPQATVTKAQAPDFFRDWLRLAPSEEASSCAADCALDLSGELTLTTGWDHLRRVHVTQRDFVLRPAPP
jgi:hypothetical protein